jgi:hypothetical protein
MSELTELEWAALAWIELEMAKDKEEGMGFLSPDTYFREQKAQNALRLIGCQVLAARAAQGRTA